MGPAWSRSMFASLSAVQSPDCKQSPEGREVECKGQWLFIHVPSKRHCFTTHASPRVDFSPFPS